jgi:hypothetical protein
MHICCTEHPGTTLPDNAPGDHQALSGLEIGERAGAARSPDAPYPLNDTTRAMVNLRAHDVPSIAMGVPRAMGNPSQRIEEIRPFDGAPGWRDEHQLFDPGASMAEGEQLPLSRVIPNSWRARPMPWDTNLYNVGVPDAQ